MLFKSKLILGLPIIGKLESGFSRWITLLRKILWWSFLAEKDNLDGRQLDFSVKRHIRLEFVLTLGVKEMGVPQMDGPGHQRRDQGG